MIALDSEPFFRYAFIALANSFSRALNTTCIDICDLAAPRNIHNVSVWAILALVNRLLKYSFATTFNAAKISIVWLLASTEYALWPVVDSL